MDNTNVVRDKDNVEELREIGRKINRVFKAIKGINLTKEEVDKFLDYFDGQEAMMPLFNPTAWMNQGRDLLRESGVRARAIMAFFEIVDKDKEK